MPETKQELEEIIKQLENISRQISNIQAREESTMPLYKLRELAEAYTYLTIAIQYLKLAKDYKK